MNSKLCLHRFTVKRSETTLHESIITLITWVLVTGNVAQSVEGTVGSDSHLGQYFIFHVQTSPKEKQKHFSYFSFDFNCISKVKKEAREKKKKLSIIHPDVASVFLSGYPRHCPAVVKALHSDNLNCIYQM